MRSHFGVAARVVEQERLDLVLTRPPFSFSRRQARRIIDEGRVVAHGKAVAVASRIIRRGERIAVIDEGVRVPFLHLTAAYVVVDKPPAIAAQIPPAGDAPSLPEVISAQLKQSGEAPDVTVVHRLDTNTTGVIVYARTAAASARLSEAIRAAGTEKRYLAIVAGRIGESCVIARPIERAGDQIFAVAESGKEAVTEIVPLAAGDAFSLVEARLRTGRTHQIRVHLSSAGHPVVGDRKYGDGSAALAPRPMLHAFELELEGFGRWRSIPPADFRDAAARFGLELPDFLRT